MNRESRNTIIGVLISIIVIGMTVFIPSVTAQSTVVSVSDASANPGETVTVPINIANVTDLCGANIWLSYDKDIVIVESITKGNLTDITSGIDNDTGVTRMNWDSDTGRSGNFVFAYVTLKANGTAGQTSVLHLDVKELYNSDLDDISYTVDDGIFEILSPIAPVVSIQDASANPREQTDKIPIYITNVIDLAGANIWLSYDKDVVIVESVDKGNLTDITFGIDNDNGVTRMNWDSETGKTGNFVFAYVTLYANGTVGQTSVLHLDVKELYNSDLEDIPYTPDVGTFGVIDTRPPVIISVVLSPDEVTPGGSITITVKVTDNDRVTKVTADGIELTKLDGDIWTGSITALSAIGSHPVTVIAYDAVLNKADTSRSYTTKAPIGPGGGGAAPRDSDGDGVIDIDEMLAGTDKDDPCDPNPECAACLAIRPTPTPVVTPTPTPVITPTPPPPVTPTPSPTPAPTPTPPGFEAVFAIAGLLAIAYVVLRKKK